MPVLSLLAALACVIGILVLSWWATRQIGRYGGMAGLGGQAAELCVLRQIPVGRAERIVLVRLHGRCLLLGTAQGGVTLLTELTEEEAAAWKAAAGPAQKVDFLGALRSSVERKK